MFKGLKFELVKILWRNHGVKIGKEISENKSRLEAEKKKEKQAAELRNSIDVGDEVTTIGGIVGRVVSIKEDTFVLETAGDRSRIRFKRWAIQDVGKLSLDSAAEAEQAIEGRKTKTDK